jgi:hypothetical protein
MEPRGSSSNSVLTCPATVFRGQASSIKTILNKRQTEVVFAIVLSVITIAAFITTIDGVDTRHVRPGLQMTPERTSHSITQELVQSNFVWANPEQISTMTRHWKRGIVSN